VHSPVDRVWTRGRKQVIARKDVTAANKSFYGETMRSPSV